MSKRTLPSIEDVQQADRELQARSRGYHFDTRRHVVEYDDVMNKQREIIYGERPQDPRGC